MDNKPGTIVVGIDGSPSADRALQWAVEQAVAERRALTLAHTIDPQNQAFNDEASIYSREVRAAVDAEGREVLRRAHAVVTRTAPTLEVHEVFDRTDPRDVLLELSEGAAMVVVGSRGRGPVRRLLLGSVSVAVVRHAKCPVVVLRPGNRGTVRNGIAVGVDASPESRPVLEFAYREASLQQLPLTVIHCVRSFPRGTAAILVP
ncbi:MAG: universal stress protein, partial [Marmoricola sp.]